MSPRSSKSKKKAKKKASRAGGGGHSGAKTFRKPIKESQRQHRMPTIGAHGADDGPDD